MLVVNIKEVTSVSSCLYEIYFLYLSIIIKQIKVMSNTETMQ